MEIKTHFLPMHVKEEQKLFSKLFLQNKMKIKEIPEMQIVRDNEISISPTLDSHLRNYFEK